MNRSTEVIGTIVISLAIAGCNASPNSPKNSPKEEAPSAVQQSGTSSFKSSAGPPDCDLNVDLINTSFRLARISSRNAPVRHVLVREKSTQTGCTNSEGMTGMIAIEGWIDQFDAGKTPTWQAQAEGHEGTIDGDFYKITKHGCCGSTDSSVYFNLTSGKQVFESTTELVRIDVPNTANSRYVAVLDSWSSANPAETKTDANVIAALEYGSASGPAERILLRLTTKNPFSVEDVSLASSKEPSKYSKTLDLWSADGKGDPSAIGDFKIRVKLIEVGDTSREVTVVIPVSSDRLDLARAENKNGIQFSKTQ